MFKFSIASLAIGATILAVGCGGHSHPHPGGAIPVVPTQKFGAPGPAAGQCAPGGNHSLGECQPSQPRAHLPLAVAPSGGLLVDLSNNDPIYGVGAFRAMRAHGVRQLYLKLTEGTGFVDGTAAQMAHDARAAGLRVGGYDFAHVCLDSAGGERQLFEQRRHATGADQLPGVLDAEYGGGCGSEWISAWRAGGERTSVYTGAWWWNPSVGCYWPSDAQAWISGYGVSYPSLPCGRSKLDSWQFSDAGFNGVSHADLSVGLLGSVPPACPDCAAKAAHLRRLRVELPRDRARNHHLHVVLPAIRRSYERAVHRPSPAHTIASRHGTLGGVVTAIVNIENRIVAVEREIHHLGG